MPENPYESPEYEPKPWLQPAAACGFLLAAGVVFCVGVYFVIPWHWPVKPGEDVVAIVKLHVVGAWASVLFVIGNDLARRKDRLLVNGMIGLAIVIPFTLLFWLALRSSLVGQ